MKFQRKNNYIYLYLSRHTYIHTVNDRLSAHGSIKPPVRISVQCLGINVLEARPVPFRSSFRTRRLFGFRNES